jgi:hypothetical protein
MEHLNLTNILLTILIALVGYIGKKFYEKIEDLGKELSIHATFHARVEEKLEDHDRRLDNLEK